MKFGVCCLLILGVLWPRFCYAQTEDPQTAQLEELQRELAERQARLAEQKASAKELEAILKESELAIGRVARALSNTRNELQTNRNEQSSLKAERRELQARISAQQAQLSAQLRSAYMAGNYDYAKMLFNQEDALKFERVLTYYQYFSKARQDAISLFRNDIAELVTVTQRLEEAERTLTQLLSRQENQQQELSARQDDRKKTLDQINRQIISDAQAVASLQENEQALIRAIEAAEAARAAARSAEVTLVGLDQVKGNLTRPAQGRVQRLFGQRRQGQVRWKGIVIEGRAGSPVNAVHDGKVLYADWLKGFGLVSIIDHGEGYMSVYGHNQALLKQAGDMVRSGETIGLVGQSGGQAYPNLYFEIRHKGKALNPTGWIAF
ncbi:peptidase M23 [Alteromonas sediminis]|uniref:Peptidase M23 n=1 Tax=Alteromonas sediminis TaxID=2259342 RepID=A0A3N5Y1G9_9ALTE|nr:peptidoglycan DD-metalloendopeptidase family protein [Alteromonas sediminis]RPJ66346.1 peptidase M23 [Alteromonas sediminis]